MTVESSFGPAPIPSYSEPEAVILASPAPSSGNPDIKAFDDADGPSFSDMLDVLNPLQHIPIINTIYRQLSGDKEGAVADVVGGALWGGLIGLGAAVANLVIEDSTGDTIEGHVVALFSGDSSDTAVAKGDRPGDRTASAATTARNDASSVIQTEPIKISGLGDSGVAPTVGKPTPGGGPVALGNFLIFGGAPAAAATAAPANDGGKMVTADAGDTLAGKATGGPARSGDFLVFGNASPSAKTGTAGAGATDQSAAGNGTATRSGDFMVFGAGQPAAGDLPAPAPMPVPTPTPAATSAPVPLTPAAGPAEKPGAVPNQTAALGSPPTRSFPIPTQRNNNIPPPVLPMPTTGPAAVPGNARAIGNTRGNSDQTGTAWFAGAFNQAMDKYNRAAGLGSTPPAAAAAQGSSASQTANSVLQMN